MLNQLVEALEKQYPLTRMDVGEFASLKVSGMKFTVNAYEAKGLGHVSTMTATGFFGLMKMDTLIIVPKDKDYPLYSYDRIHAMGNDTLYMELFDTQMVPTDFSAVDAVKAKYAKLADHDPGVHWYENIKLPQCTYKKGKKKQSKEFDALVMDFFKAYLGAAAVPVTDIAGKEEKSAFYVNGLIEHGGPSTDVFKKALGEEITGKFFKNVLFGTK